MSKKQLQSAQPTKDLPEKVLDDSTSDNYFLIMSDKGEQVHNNPPTPLKDNMGHAIYRKRYLEKECNKCTLLVTNTF